MILMIFTKFYGVAQSHLKKQLKPIFLDFNISQYFTESMKLNKGGHWYKYHWCQAWKKLRGSEMLALECSGE